MADNVVKFRKAEKRSEKKPTPPSKGPRPIPPWLPWVVLVGVAVVIVLARNAGLLGA